MDYETIKAKVDNAYQQIKDANAVLDECRKECDHPTTELVDYMWAPGHINSNTKVCIICGDVINDYNEYIVYESKH